jgi:Protein of unknown function (DUF3016)
MTPAPLLLFLALSAALPAGAADADVRFIAPERFRDAGDSARERARTTAALAAAFKAVAATLPAGQTLRIAVKDVDLAGTPQLTPRGELRVLRGGADWPRLDFAWTLESGGRVLGQGEESLADLDYQQTPLPRYGGVALPYEQRLIERWAAQRFTTAVPH